MVTAKYFIEKDTNIKDWYGTVKNIIKKSGWNNEFQLIEVNNRKDADIVITLAERPSLDKYHTTPIYYDDGREVRLSWTIATGNYKRKILIDKENWLNGVPDSGLSIKDYRTYVINHEFGHGLGFEHQPCDCQGQKCVCPVMYQMTRGVPEYGVPGYTVTPQDYTGLLQPRSLWGFREEQ
jgi:predicted Zn-dependent protease